EIKEYVQWCGQAAKNAVEGAGFDGVEVHGTSGYHVDQFLQDVSNTRTDVYGGSIENRARFTLGLMDAVVGAVGASTAAIRLSPWNTYQDMHMEDPVPQFTYLVDQFKQRFPKRTSMSLRPARWLTSGQRSLGCVVIGYGMPFLTNPDLPFRLKKHLALNFSPDYSMLFTTKTAGGYTTYPFSEEFLKTQTAWAPAIELTATLLMVVH
ncbi:uncharacterized protein BXZ73DRAFT_56253, partial [Epithele typhae]|uniref:uncharacterized protein n=1 Tax=Epithele typhae TaxID=378194 RepID=UPI00200782F5